MAAHTDDLGDSLKALGPSLGAALDLLRSSISAEDFGNGCRADRSRARVRGSRDPRRLRPTGWQASRALR